jgi:hypothetical protein
MKTIFYQRCIGPSNLLPYQKYLLHILCQSEWWIVVPTNKNLGPAIMERTKYIFLIYRDHLSDESTYRRLSEQDAYAAIAAIADVRSKIQKLLFDEQSAFSDKDLTLFLQRSLDVESPFAEFYALIKIHKTPIATRPIVSQCGSILHGLGRWFDQQLQPLVRQLPCYIKVLQP